MDKIIFVINKFLASMCRLFVVSGDLWTYNVVSWVVYMALKFFQSINRKLQISGLQNIFQSLILECEKVPNYLIGDLAYPLTCFYIKKFDHCQNDDEAIFNKMLKRSYMPALFYITSVSLRLSLLILSK